MGELLSWAYIGEVCGNVIMDKQPDSFQITKMLLTSEVQSVKVSRSLRLQFIHLTHPLLYLNPSAPGLDLLSIHQL